jgi:hypothetical protein
VDEPEPALARDLVVVDADADLGAFELRAPP